MAINKKWNINKINQLTNKLNKIEDKFKNIIADISTTTETSNVYFSKMQTQIRKLYQELRNITRVWTENTFPDAFNYSLRTAIYDIKHLKV